MRVRVAVLRVGDEGGGDLWRTNLIQICNEGDGGGVEGGDEGGDDLQWTNFDPNIQTW